MNKVSFLFVYLIFTNFYVDLMSSLEVVDGIKDYAKLTEECGVLINAGYALLLFSKI